jgi:hypothetical protein
MTDNPTLGAPPHLRIRWSLTSLGFALLAACYLIAALAQTRFEWFKDREVQFEFVGPFAKWVLTIAIAGWISAGIGALIAFVAKDREWSKAAVVLSNTSLTIITILALASFGFLLLLSQ